MVTKVKGEERKRSQSFTYRFCLPFMAYRKDIFGELYACSVAIEFLFKIRSDKKAFDIYISNHLQMTSPFHPQIPYPASQAPLSDQCMLLSQLHHTRSMPKKGMLRQGPELRRYIEEA